MPFSTSEFRKNRRWEGHNFVKGVNKIKFLHHHRACNLYKERNALKSVYIVTVCIITNLILIQILFTAQYELSLLSIIPLNGY